jgi:translation initiation factor 3 subunit E
MSSPEEFDLTSKNARFMDRHLLIPLVDFLATKKMHTTEELNKSKLEILAKTNMIDSAMEIKGAPAELSKKRDEVVKTMQALEEEVKPILSLVSDAGRVAELKAERCFNQSYLQQQLNISAKDVEVLQRYAKFMFECGNYRVAADLLAHYRQLTLDAEGAFSALWGKLAGEILMKNWEGAHEDLTALRELIDSRTTTSAALQLQQRCWLMHWALFLLGNHPNGRAIVCDLFMQEKYIQTIQTNAPHLLRYLVVAIVTNPRRRDKVRELVRVIGIERPNFSDPITKLLEDLHTHADFDAAQARLKECATVLDHDFFLQSLEELFLKSARLSLFESYCRIHERIDLSSLGEKLGMEQIAAEKWIVKMVSDAQLNAKIDSQSGHVLMGAKPADVYQQVIEKTKGLSFRSYVLAQNIEKRSSAVA